MPRRASLLRRPPETYRPHLLPLEDRLPLGDGVLGLLAGAALLPAAIRGTGLQPVASGDRLQTCPTVPGQLAGFTLNLHGMDAFDSPAVVAGTTTPDEHARADFHASSPGRSARRADGPEAVPSLVVSMRTTVSPGAAALAMPSPAVVASRSEDTLLSLLAGMRTTPGPAAGTVTPTQEAQVKESFGKLPLSFEQNVGQTDASVHFFTRGPGYATYLTATEAVMVLSQPKAADVGTGLQPVREPGQVANLSPREEAPPAVVRMQFVGANPTPTVTGREQQPGIVNYFLGNDPAKWHTNVHIFGRVEYDEVYPGIDLVYYGNQRQLEYDFVVSPGADPQAIRLNVTGAERVEIDGAGDLALHTGGQEVRQHKPFVYQEVNGTRQEVASRFVLDDGQVRFDVAAYDTGRPLMIDPVLSYSTYLGGSLEDEGSAIAVDAYGSALVTGQTLSPNFPTADPFQPSYGGGIDAFVTKLSADGSALVYSTYLGGRGGDRGDGIAVDGAGNAFITGYTNSSNFPTANPFQPNYAGGLFDPFVTRLSADGSALVYSTYLGGSSDDWGSGIAVDASGSAFVTGWTASRDFPTTKAFQPSYSGGGDLFIAKLKTDGSALVYSTYLGGGIEDSGSAIAVDASGSAFVTGWTQSPNFPTAKPFQPSFGGSEDAFVARLSADGSALVYSTYLGGSRLDLGRGLAVDPATGDALVTGTTSSTDFPTAGPFQPNQGGARDAFVARLSADGLALVYSTYLGGSNVDDAHAIAVDASGSAFVTGLTLSPDFPTANPLQRFYGTNWDAFVTRLSADGSALVYSTYLGGVGGDHGFGIAVDGAGSAFVTGYTNSPNFPTAHPFQPSRSGRLDAFVSQLGSSPVASYYVYPDSGQVQEGVPFDLHVFALDVGANIISDYTGEIAFFSTDKQAALPEPYTFQRSDQGVAYFFEGVTFLTPGTQEVYVLDTATYSVLGYAVFEVV